MDQDTVHEILLMGLAMLIAVVIVTRGTELLTSTTPSPTPTNNCAPKTPPTQFPAQTF
jgi:hypothetical protein